MKQHQKEDLQSRRDFLRQSTCASLGVTGLVNMLAHMRLMTAAMAQGSTGGDYKALVCIFLAGGNDSNNMLLPIGDPTTEELRSDYETARGVLALDRLQCHTLNVPTTTKAFQKHLGSALPTMGVHPNAQPLADLFNAGELAFVCNAGSLAFPIQTRDEYVNHLVPRPPQLFSHADQQVQWQSSIPDKPFTSGWGGRMADLMHASYNSDSKVSMSISLAGKNSFQMGTSGVVSQYAVTSSGVRILDGYGTNYASAYIDPNNPSAGYQTGDSGQRLRALDNIMKLTHENLLEDEYAQIFARARATQSLISSTTAAADASDVDYDAKFASADSSLGDQLKMVAKLIAGRNVLGNNRQIFFVQVSGYDTHQVQLESHGNLMQELANALKAFRDTLADPDIDIFNNVTAFTASDFSRTLTPNGEDAATGTGHGWGSHCMVMGGSVIGGDLYGHFNSLKTGASTGSMDSDSSRGRWIPDTSVDQYASVMARWLGVGSSELETIFPNLPRFDDPLTTSTANLNFMQPTTP